MMPRWARAIAVALATIVALAVGCTWGIFERGEAWLSARWTLPATVGATLGLPTWIPALAMGLLGLAAAGWVVWRMTLGGDRRVPRLALPTLARSSPGRAAGARSSATPRCPARRGDLPRVLALARPQNVLRGENAEERGIDIVIVLDLSGSMRA